MKTKRIKVNVDVHISVKGDLCGMNCRFKKFDQAKEENATDAPGAICTILDVPLFWHHQDKNKTHWHSQDYRCKKIVDEQYPTNVSYDDNAHSPYTYKFTWTK